MAAGSENEFRKMWNSKSDKCDRSGESRYASRQDASSYDNDNSAFVEIDPDTFRVILTE